MIVLVAAVAHNNIIGYRGNIPWRLKSDLKFFKELTKDSVVVMGRKTWESLPVKPLKNRINVVVSSNYNAQNCFNLSSYGLVEQMYEALVEPIGKKMFIIGGSSAYNHFIPLADEMYITHVDTMPCGDTFFPFIDTDVWSGEIVQEQKEPDESNQFPFKIIHYTRTSKDN